MVRGLPVYKMWKGGERAKGGDPVDRIGISIPAAFRPLSLSYAKHPPPPNVHTHVVWGRALSVYVRFEPLGMPGVRGVKKLVAPLPLCRNNLHHQCVDKSKANDCATTHLAPLHRLTDLLLSGETQQKIYATGCASKTSRLRRWVSARGSSDILRMLIKCKRR